MPKKGGNPNQYRVNGKFATKPQDPTPPSPSDSDADEVDDYLQDLPDIFANMTLGDIDTSHFVTTEQFDQLLATVNAMASKLSATPAPPADPPAPPAQPDAPPPPPFVPPISRATGAFAPSLRSLFPQIEAAHITAITSHQFAAGDLWKLDSKYRGKETPFSFNATTMQFETSNRAARDYKTVDSLFIPLVVYINILTTHLLAQPAQANTQGQGARPASVPFVFFQFISHFHKMAAEYEWPAVLEYVMAFLAHRRLEMLDDGDYSKWGTLDADLKAEHLIGHRKVPAKVIGRTGSPSPSSRPCLASDELVTTVTGFSSSDISLPHSELFPHRAPPPCRPNTDPRANAPPVSTDVQPPRVSSTLRAPAWSHFLRHYPDRLYVDTLNHIIHYGANLAFSGDKTTSQSCTNLKSAFETPAVTSALSADITAQVANGRTRGPFTEFPFHNFRCSPLGAVTRKRSSKVRRIHHLSWPRTGSVNEGIPDSQASIAYDMVDRAISDLIASGPGSLMTKLDLESAFRHIPVRKADWHLLGFTWEGNYYYDVVLGFGCRSAPYIFNLFGEGMHWIMQSHLPARIRHYLDDFLTIFPPSVPRPVVDKALDWSLALGTELGLKFQPSKIEGPSTQIEFLGLELDSDVMEVRLPPQKLAYLTELLDSWDGISSCSKLQVEELTGFLQFASQVVPTARAALRGLYDFAASFTSRFQRRIVPKSARRDIAWWKQFALSWNGIRFISPQRETLHIYTDAAGTKGLGGHFGSQWFSARCPRRYRHEHIQVKEMMAVVHAVLCWGEELSRKHVVFHVDNEAVFSGINNLTIKSVPTMFFLRKLIQLACRLDFSISSVWLSSSENAVADAASRFSFTRMFELAPYLNPKPSSKRLRIGGTPSALSSQKPSPFTYGMASPPAHEEPTQRARNLSSTFPVSTACTTLTAPSSLPLSTPSCHGSHTWRDASNLRPLKPTSLPFVPSTRTLICPSLLASHLPSDVLFEGSSSTTANLQPGVTAGHTSIYAACCVAYAGLLRSGEFTTKKPGSHNAALNLSRQHIKFLPSFENPTHVLLTLPSSKTDPFRKGVTITIAAAPSRVSCPVTALKRLFTELPDRSGMSPLFENPDGSPLTYDHFVKTIRSALESAGHTPSSYAGHSFRRGAASAAAAAGRYDVKCLSTAESLRVLGVTSSTNVPVMIPNDEPVFDLSKMPLLEEWALGGVVCKMGIETGPIGLGWLSRHLETISAGQKFKYIKLCPVIVGAKLVTDDKLDSEGFEPYFENLVVDVVLPRSPDGIFFYSIYDFGRGGREHDTRADAEAFAYSVRVKHFVFSRIVESSE
ncbi:hypothetical protein D9613_008807 [Agrocybe pediades]|uniref:Reverse transcriptase domain-containing protein n=1 Tax=Agrocybe pediades TaxID=84607 RepID=A0A8H4VN18_9AGAR|nr:hypothetical protein D9613_008807 [Agrocybe pediades]